MGALGSNAAGQNAIIELHKCYEGALMDDDEAVGARIRRYRRTRGLSLDQAAGLAGISKPYLSRLERGERSVDSRALLNQIAFALEASISDLIGQPYRPRDRDHAQALRGVSGTRLALLDPTGPVRPEAEIAAEIANLDRLMNSCDLVRQARVIPDLLRCTQQYALEVGSLEAHRRAVVAAYAATFFSRNLGECDLAWMAADRMRDAAEKTCDQATIGFAGYAQAHALAAAGALRRAVATATAAAGATTGSGAEEVAARGSCLLVSAAVTATLGDIDGARAQLDEAATLAQRLTVPTLIARHTSFAPWNVTMHRVSVEVECGSPAAAVAAARPLILAPIRHPERMSYLWVDIGRALSRLDRHREAIEALRRAERTAPLRVRLSPVVQDSVRDLLGKNYRYAAGAQLRGLAERCGVLSES
jgi:transcriptional regulator with XRE-family HTH domain